MLKLLQHRIGQAGQKGIPTQHQHRQSVGMRQSRRGEQIGCTRTSTGRAEHKPLAQPLFGVSCGRKPHALLVLSAVKRQRLTVVIKRFAKAGYIPMAKNTKATAT